MPTIRDLPTFKRLGLKAKFTNREGLLFKKISNKGAYRVLDTGTCQTHALIHFAKNTRVALASN